MRNKPSSVFSSLSSLSLLGLTVCTFLFYGIVGEGALRAG